LEDHRPGNYGKKNQDKENYASYPSGLSNKVDQIGDKNRCKRKNDVNLAIRGNFFLLQQRSTRFQSGQKD
jgi:hypothetical protein